MSGSELETLTAAWEEEMDSSSPAASDATAAAVVFEGEGRWGRRQWTHQKQVWLETVVRLKPSPASSPTA